MKKKPHAAPARASEEQSGAKLDASAENAPALWFVRTIAVLAVIAVLLGRAFGPSVRGVAVGLGKLGERIELIGASVSQGFLMLATVVALALVLAVLRPGPSSFVRFVSVTLGGLVTLATLSASATKLPASSLAVSGGLACALALVAAHDTFRTPFARAAAIVLGLVAVGGLARVLAIVMLTREKAPGGYPFVAQTASTVGLLLDVLALVVAFGFVASRSRKPASPPTIVALGAALVAMRLALGAKAEDAGVVSVLFDRAARALIVRPEPFGSQSIHIFFAFAAPCMALAVLLTPTLTPALSGAIALMLLAHGSPDVPLCALMIVIASLATILAARDDRGIWAEIKRTDEVSSPGSSPGARSSQSQG